MADLKPCPFCGGEATVDICDGSGMYHMNPRNGNVLYGRNLTHKMILCKKCGIKTTAYLTDKGVFNAWNRRASKTDQEKLVVLIQKTFDEQYTKRGLLTAYHTAEYLLFHGVTVKEMQKPLTVEEMRKKDVVYLEERHGRRISVPCFIDPASTEHDMYFFTGLSCVFTHRVKSYNKYWRCWAEKPTEEERKAAEWER